MVRRWPILREYMVATAWDATLARPEGGWLQDRTTQGTIYQGWVRVAADSAQTGDLDLYLYDPVYVTETQGMISITGAEGVLIPRAAIESVVRFAPDAPVAQ